MIDNISLSFYIISLNQNSSLYSFFLALLVSPEEWVSCSHDRRWSKWCCCSEGCRHWSCHGPDWHRCLQRSCRHDLGGWWLSNNNVRHWFSLPTCISPSDNSVWKELAGLGKLKYDFVLENLVLCSSRENYLCQWNTHNKWEDCSFKEYLLSDSHMSCFSGHRMMAQQWPFLQSLYFS